MKREFLQGLKVGDQPLSREVIDAIMAQNGQDIQQAKQASEVWEEKYNQALTSHRRELEQLRLQTALESAVTKAGGRNQKAVAALLDMEAIAASPDVPAALDAALQTLRQEHGWLFEAPTPPPFAPFTGAAEGKPEAPVTLAGALRERSKQ